MYIRAIANGGFAGVGSASVWWTSNSTGGFQLRIIRVGGYPPNGIFGPLVCLLAGGCGAWRLLARRRVILCRYHLGQGECFFQATKQRLRQNHRPWVGR